MDAGCCAGRSRGLISIGLGLVAGSMSEKGLGGSGSGVAGVVLAAGVVAGVDGAGSAPIAEIEKIAAATDSNALEVLFRVLAIVLSP